MIYILFAFSLFASNLTLNITFFYHFKHTESENEFVFLIINWFINSYWLLAIGIRSSSP